MDAPATEPRLSLLSPVLVGRDEVLRLTRRRVEEARAGQGELLLISGEAGIGKSRLVSAIARHAALSGCTVVVAAAYPNDVEVAGGLLLELAAALGRSEEVAHREVGTRLRERVLAPSAAPDPHRARRLATIDTVSLIASVAETSPALIVLEDLHWADDFSVEAFAHLARALPRLPLLVVAAFRSDELYPSVPLRAWRAGLLNQRLAEEVPLARLGPDETATMANAIAGAPLPRPVVEMVHDRSDGVPLHVEELLAVITDRDAAAATVATVPSTLADAILSRADDLSSSTRRIAEIAAVIGRSFEVDLLADAAEVVAEQLGEPLGELESRFFVVPMAEGHGYDFRHALIRDALYAAIPLPARRALHARVAEALLARSGRASHAVLSAHYEMAGSAEAAYRHALAAAVAATHQLAHRDAATLYERALRNEPVTAGPAEHAAVAVALAAEAAAIDDNERAAARYEEARAAFLATGDRIAAASVLPRLAAVRHLLGADLAERVDLLETALETATEPRPAATDGDATEAGERAGVLRTEALAGLAAAYMLDRRLDASIRFGELARAAAIDNDLQAAELNAAATLASVLVFAGHGDEGWTLHEQTIARARAAELETEAGRAFRMAGSCASVLVEYDRAERWLEDGIAYTERVELWNHRHYMAAHLGHVAWATGDWSRAAGIARHALADGGGGITTRVTALHVLGYVDLGLGRYAEARESLEEARAIGERMAELQRFSPALWGLAECALLEGRPGAAIETCRLGLAESAAVDDGAYLFPFLVTGTRAYLAARDPAGATTWCEEVSARLEARGIAGTLPAIDHAQGLILLAQGATGRARSALEAAVAGWQRRRRWWEGTWAMLDLARCHRRANRPGPAMAMASAAHEMSGGRGSLPLLTEAERLLEGLPTTDAGSEVWAPLTAREFEVARLIANGATNIEIAAELGIAPKTASAHVEHILTKLGLARRSEVAAWVATLEPGAPRATGRPG